jgi:glycosyltransferase involved in cell wall biosynthesis
MSNTSKPVVFVYVINVDWYFDLHWVQRAKATLQTGAQVHIVMGTTDAEIFRRFSELGFICHQWQIDRKSMNPWTNLLRLIELHTLLKRLAPTIIHAITIKPNICVGLLAHLLRIPYVLSVTGTGVIFSGKSLTVRLMKPIVRLLYKLCSHKVNRRMVFENREDHQYFVSSELCPEQQAITILGAGVDTAQFKTVQENLTQSVKILFAARLLWDKGLGDLVEAGKQLRERNIDFTLDVAGIIDHSTINAIPEEVISNWAKKADIHWLGTIKDMPALIAKSNIVTLPSFYGEGVPRILIEAAACSRAIVTTDMPGCREIGRHQLNALLVQPRDITALADALETLIKDEKLRLKLAKQGRKIVEREFSEQQVIAETLALYQELLS